PGPAVRLRGRGAGRRGSAGAGSEQRRHAGALQRSPARACQRGRRRLPGRPRRVLQPRPGGGGGSMQRLNSIADAMRALYEFIPQTVATRAGYSLDRLRAFLAGIGDPQDGMRVVHVAGTSGKTSTSYFIRALLQSAGQVTGLTVSPHIVSVTERVQL